MLKKITVDYKELVDLLTNVFKDAESGITEEWDPSSDKSGYKAQQTLIEKFCNTYNIDLNISHKWIVKVTTYSKDRIVLTNDFLRDSRTNSIRIFEDDTQAISIANLLTDEFTETEVSKYYASEIDQINKADSPKYVIEIRDWLLGQEVNCDYYRDFMTSDLMLYESEEEANLVAVKMENEFCSTKVVQYIPPSN